MMWREYSQALFYVPERRETFIHRCQRHWRRRSQRWVGCDHETHLARSRRSSVLPSLTRVPTQWLRRI